MNNHHHKHNKIQRLDRSYRNPCIWYALEKREFDKNKLEV